MFDAKKIEAKFYGVVGLRQPYNPAFAILDADNQVSRSGHYATDNPYVKVEHLKGNVDYVDISDADFNNKLKQLQEESIINVCSKVFNASDYIDRQVLYPYTQNKVNTENLTGGFIAHKIEVSDKKNLAFEISRVLLSFEGSGTLKLMLFNTSKTTPLFTKDIAISTTNHEEYLNWKVDDSEDTYKGEYYLGYRSNDAALGTLKPFKRDYENSDIEADISCLNIDKFIFEGHSTDTLPDLTTEDSTDQSTGLNPDITVFEDYTGLILQNEVLFARAINLDFQINCIGQYLASLRSNRDERNSERITLRLVQEIEGQEGDGLVKITGLRPQLSRSISHISNEIDRLRKGYFGDRIQISTML